MIPTNSDNLLIAHQINTEVRELEVAQQILSLLEKANKEIAKYIKKYSSIETKKQYKVIKKQLKQISNDLLENIKKGIDIDKFLGKELSELSQIFDGDISVSFKIPSVEQIKSSALFTPYAVGGTFETYLKNISSTFFNTWDTSVRTGYLTGIPTKDIVNQVIGSLPKNASPQSYGTMQTLRNSIEANTRTALQSFSTVARNETYKKNAEFIDGYKWLSTLDRKTCLVCGNLSGHIYNTLDEVYKVGMPPRHINCRCVITPFIKEFADMKTVQASENGYVDGNVSYEEWLSVQSEKTKEEVLGATRYKLYKETDGQKIGGFVNNNKILKISELKENIKKE